MTRPDPPAINPAVGLCSACAHAQVVSSARGATFYLCRLSAVRPEFRRYPTLPVLICGGFARPDRSGS